MSNQKPKTKDVVSTDKKVGWLYSPKVKDHFFKPRNIQLTDPKKDEFNGIGTVGSPVCGDMMTLWIKVDPKTNKIKKCTWRTFGCASAIASTSMLSTMVIGMKLDKAKKITSRDILKKLGGLPARKVHCSVLGDQALRAAIKNYEKSRTTSK